MKGGCRGAECFGLLNGSYFIDISGSITISRSLNFLRRLISNLGDASTVTKLREKDEKKSE